MDQHVEARKKKTLDVSEFYVNSSIVLSEFLLILMTELLSEDSQYIDDLVNILTRAHIYDCISFKKENK